MTEEEKSQIQILRESGYSYGEIARILHLHRNTVINHCLRHNIATSNLRRQDGAIYKLCPKCKKLFVATGRQRNAQQFCSEECRMQYWQREFRNEKMLKEEADSYRTLQKGLDLFLEERDEWMDARGVILCCRKEPLLNQEKEK